MLFQIQTAFALIIRLSKLFRAIYFLVLISSILTSCTTPIEDKKVAILAFDDFPHDKTALAVETLQNFYHCQIELLPTSDLPKSAFIDVKSPRYRADSLLHFLKSKCPKDCDHIVGLTAHDISFTKRINGCTKKPKWKYEDWGIMGLAHCPGTSCIVSDYRIGRSVNSAIANDRFKKVLAHELGHCLGLPHCRDKKCLIRDAAESVKTIDNVAFDLCPACKKQIRLD